MASSRSTSSRPASPAGQRHPVGRAGPGSEAEARHHLVQDFLGQVTVGRDLAADDRREAPGGAAVVADEVAPRDGAGFAQALAGQRAHAAVGVEHVVPREPAAGKGVAGFREQVVHLGGRRPQRRRLVVAAGVGGADQHQAVPGQDEEGPPVGAGLGVAGGSGQARERPARRCACPWSVPGSAAGAGRRPRGSGPPRDPRR